MHNHITHSASCCVQQATTAIWERDTQMCVSVSRKGKKQQLAGHSTLADKAMKHSGSGSSPRPPLSPLPAVPPATATTTTRTRPLPGPTESTENAKLWH